MLKRLYKPDVAADLYEGDRFQPWCSHVITCAPSQLTGRLVWHTKGLIITENKHNALQKPVLV